MMNYLFLLLFQFVLFSNINCTVGENVVPYINLDPKVRFSSDVTNLKVNRKARGLEPDPTAEYLPFEMLIDKDKDKDTSEYWRETEILSLVRNRESEIDYARCEQSPTSSVVQFESKRAVRPICKDNIDHQLCPQCPRFNNFTECELFRDSCKERKVLPSEHHLYCERKYGKFRTMFVPSDYSNCRCCDECIPYRELDQSCVQDEYSFDSDEFLPVTSLDFRAGCNPYWGHPEQELKALRCDQVLRRCVPINVPKMPNETIAQVSVRHFRFQPLTRQSDCPISCRGYNCYEGLVTEKDCVPGAFLPHKDKCNCCGTCSSYQQLNQKCANFKKTFHVVNNATEIEVEEEFLEPGCDDGLVCRQGYCQDIHTVQPENGGRKKRDEGTIANGYLFHEPCKQEMKYFKKKFGADGHLHFNAPQCTPLWLYAPVQCRRFVCFCALEDGSLIEGIKVPRVEVSNMNCDCAREKCRTNSDVECDGYGNYKEAVFTPHVDEWGSAKKDTDNDEASRGSDETEAPFSLKRATADTTPITGTQRL